MPVIATVLTSKKFSSVSDLEHGVCSWVYHPAEGDNLSGKQGYFKAEIPRFRLLSDVISKVPEGEQLLLTLRCLEVGWAGASRSFSVAEGSCHRACGNAAPSVPAWQSTKFYPNGAGFRLNLYGRLFLPTPTTAQMCFPRNSWQGGTMIVTSGHMLLNGWGLLDKEGLQTRLFCL